MRNSNNATPKRIAVSCQKQRPTHANKTNTDRAKPSRKKRTMMRLMSTKVCSMMQWCPFWSLDDDEFQKQRPTHVNKTDAVRAEP
mmetsp:Transcript_31926/g.57742  ORF Transcript_31926/g.57742 Transcript_31926/m.57742 type:complete len:85 (+) Transcript_31926:624-878(+)